MSIEEDLERLTRGLQRLEEERRAGRKPVELPMHLNPGDLIFLPGVQRFLDERRKYDSLIRDVSVGQY